MQIASKKYWQLIIAVLCLIAFYPVFKGSFINYDDTDYITNNPYIKHLNANNIINIFKGKGIDLYIPLTMLSYSIEIFLFGESATLFHVTNLLLHIINAILLLTILNRINNNNQSITILILLFFTLNPLVTESVCWVSGRKDLLYTCFIFLASIQFLKYNSSQKQSNLIASITLFILACLSKPMAISFPILITLYILYKTETKTIKPFLVLIPFYLISVLFAYVAVNRFSPLTLNKTFIIPNYSFIEKTTILLSEIGFYFFKPFAPFSHSLFHSYPKNSEVFSNNSIFVFSLFGLVIICVTMYAWVKQKNKQILYLILAWFALLVPVLQIIPNTHTYVSERYFYLTIIFPVTITVLYFKDKISIKTLNSASLILIPIFVVLTHNRSKDWKNTITLFEHEIKINSNNSIALNNLGMYYTNNNNQTKAYQYFKRAIIADTTNYKYLSNYALTLNKLGELDSAMIYFQKSLKLNGDNIEALNNLGIICIQKKEREKAFPFFLKAYQLSPNNAEVCCNLGIYYYNSKQFNEAKPLLEKANDLGSERAFKYLQKLNDSSIAKP